MERLARVAAGRRVPPDEVDDVVQEALLTAWRKCPPRWWREDSSRLQRWLLVVVRRMAIDRARRLMRHPVQSLDAAQAGPRDRREEEAASLERRERLGAFQKAWLEELRASHPVNYRLLHGRFFEGSQVKELAAEEGLSANAASCRISWAMAWLRTRAAKFLKEEAE